MKDKLIGQEGKVMDRQYWKDRYGLWKTKSRKKPKDDIERKQRDKFSQLNPELYDKNLLKELKKQLIEIYGKECMRCSSTEKIVIDHIISRAIGGTNDLDNLQLLCWKCNKVKGVYKTDDYRN